MPTYLKSWLYQIAEWQALDPIYSVSEFRFKLWNWKSPRRFVVVREQLQTTKPAVGRKLIDLPGYVFRVFVNWAHAFAAARRSVTQDMLWSTVPERVNFELFFLSPT
jgi:hypothetical protein